MWTEWLFDDDDDGGLARETEGNEEGGAQETTPKSDNEAAENGDGVGVGVVVSGGDWLCRRGSGSDACG